MNISDAALILCQYGFYPKPTTNLSKILPALAIIDHQFSSNSETNATLNENLKNILQSTFVEKSTLLDTTGQPMFDAIGF